MGSMGALPSGARSLVQEGVVATSLCLDDRRGEWSPGRRADGGTVGVMGLRAGFWKLLAKGGDEAAPDELVELVTVPQHEGPLMAADLEAHGIEATLEDAFDLVTRTLSSSRIMVRRIDLAAAQDVITA